MRATLGLVLICGICALSALGCAGEDGSGCTVAENPDGTATIRCTDGSSYTVGAGGDGVDGVDGSTALVDVTPEPAGENCAHGGARIDAGLDDDADGTLGEDEIDSTEYVCNGAGSTPTLVLVSEEAPGSACRAGGQRIDTGLDDGEGGETAGDGVLGTGEIDSTEYVCNGADGRDGADGVSTLVTVTSVPPGATCAAGGERIDAGLDDGDGGETAGDGVLGAGEIDATEYVCNGADGGDGTDGFDTLVSMTAEPPGTNCRAGGQRIDAGLDDGDGGGTARNGTLEAGEIDATAYVCHGSSFLTPGSPTTATLDGWSVRCLSWSGEVCTRMQMMMSCGVCSTYPNCDVWHDVTEWNNGSNRTALNWCAIATGDPTLVSVGAGGTASAPYGCGYHTDSHPQCEAGRASYHASGFGIDPNLGLLLNPTYCSSGGAVLLTVECAGW